MTGLVDIHSHGALGHEFGRDTQGSREAAAHHRATGSDTLVASIVTAAPADLIDRVQVLAALVADGTLAGIHLEGPFLSDAQRGAHDPVHLTDPDTALVDLMVQSAAEAGAPSAIRQLTFAPERPGSADLVRTLVAHGIRPAVGHTNADGALVSRFLADVAARQGFPAHVTHLFNGMPPFHHRAGGPVAAALAAAARGEAVVELITDGVHVAPDVVRMVFETIGPDAVVLVSDAMAATGLGDGFYRLGSLDVVVVAGTSRLVSTGSIAGSTSTLADCLRWAVDVARVDPTDALRAATRTPAHAMGIDGTA